MCYIGTLQPDRFIKLIEFLAWSFLDHGPASIGTRRTGHRFFSHLYQSRRVYRRACETAGKSGKQIERCVISTFQIADNSGL